MAQTIILFALFIFTTVFFCLILMQLQEQADIIVDIKTMLRTYFTNELVKKIKESEKTNNATEDK